MDPKYKLWLSQLKMQIRSAQIKAALKVNAELLALYWQLGKEIVEKETRAQWGDKWLHQLSKDLMREFPQIKGFSHTNLKYIRRWYQFYSIQIGQQAVAQLQNPNVQQDAAHLGDTTQQAVGQVPTLLTSIPWGHHLQVITKCKTMAEALFYINETSAHGWSRNVLVYQIESGLYNRKGTAITNFDATLPKPQSDLAKELFKDPYKFDFLGLGEEHLEKDLRVYNFFWNRRRI